eukprot:762407-Ditylum_brightwellii.AAC.1
MSNDTSNTTYATEVFTTEAWDRFIYEMYIYESTTQKAKASKVVKKTATNQVKVKDEAATKVTTSTMKMGNKKLDQCIVQRKTYSTRQHKEKEHTEATKLHATKQRKINKEPEVTGVRDEGLRYDSFNDEMKEIPTKKPETTLTMLTVAMPKEEAQECNHMKKISELKETNVKLQAQIKVLREKLDMALTNKLNDSDFGGTKSVDSLKMENKLLGVNQCQDNEDSGKILDIDMAGVLGSANKTDLVVEVDEKVESTTAIAYTRKHQVLEELFGSGYEFKGVKFLFEEPPNQMVQTHLRIMKEKYFKILGRPPWRHEFAIQITSV